MIWMIIGVIFLGIIIGKIDLLSSWLPHIDVITSGALALLLFGVGIDIGNNQEIWHKIKQKGWKIILVPISVALGTIVGAALSGIVLKMPINESTAIGAGLGWYSLSGGLLAKIYSIDIGAIAFLANVFRELLAVFLIPFLAKNFGGYLPIAPGGATTMDTTLPIINKFSGQEVAIIAFVSGVLLSILVPILVPILINIS